jgi:RNA polymerase-binding transcription factor DksA
VKGARGYCSTSRPGNGDRGSGAARDPRSLDHEIERERALLAEVERALAKLDQGTYGVSEKTGAPITYERLAAMPWARHDVEE